MIKGIEELQAEIADEFSCFSDGFDKYAYLIELGALLPEYPDDKRTTDRLVRGCQSRVWLDVQVKDGIFNFSADSDTHIIKGILYLLQIILNGQSADKAAAAELVFFRMSGIEGLLSGERQKGIGYIIELLKQRASSFAQV